MAGIAFNGLGSAIVAHGSSTMRTPLGSPKEGDLFPKNDLGRCGIRLWHEPQERRVDRASDLYLKNLPRLCPRWDLHLGHASIRCLDLQDLTGPGTWGHLHLQGDPLLLRRRPLLRPRRRRRVGGLWERGRQVLRAASGARRAPGWGRGTHRLLCGAPVATSPSTSCAVHHVLEADRALQKAALGLILRIVGVTLGQEVGLARGPGADVLQSLEVLRRQQKRGDVLGGDGLALSLADSLS
mmetsp:Transcript_135260/g.432390  ORF Transcript_135260/g.432390 Transcript_135260/m.432390 type:complete len:240 (+) Transcript_135260:150-869(+)